MIFENSAINYLAVITGAVLSMIIGAIWYGPLFGRKWMEIAGVNLDDIEARKKMQKSAGPLYMVQFLLTLFQVLILSFLLAEMSQSGKIERALWIWAAFVVPTLAGSVMWTNEKKDIKLARFLIQGGYQLVMFITYGLLLQFWK